MTNPPPLKDIYKYFGVNYIPGENPYRLPNGANYGNDTFRYREDSGGENGIRTESWDLNPDSWLGRINDQYGMGFKVERDQGEQARSWRANFDSSKLPQTKFGNVTETLSTDEQGSNLVNRNMKYYDPNYGWVSLAKNYKRENGWVGPALMAAVTMGLGGLGMPALAISGMKGLKGMMTGNPLGAALSFLPGALGGMGLGEIGSLLKNPMMGMATKMFLANAIKNRRKG